MKKLLFLIISVLCFSNLAAQDDGESSYGSQEAGTFGKRSSKKIKKNVVLLGPKAGLVFTTMTQPDQCDLYDGSGFGFQGGAALRFRFGQATHHSVGGTGMWGAAIEMKYVQDLVKTIADDDLEIDYFAVPVMVQCYPFCKSKGAQNLYLEAGAAIAGTLSSSPEYLQAENVRFKTGDIAGFDFRPLIGIGYTVPNTGLDFNARYYLGTSELAGNMASKMNSFEVSVAWMFNLGKF